MICQQQYRSMMYGVYIVCTHNVSHPPLRGGGDRAPSQQQASQTEPRLASRLHTAQGLGGARF